MSPNEEEYLDDFVVEYDIPLPADRRASLKYPWHRLDKVGATVFFAPDSEQDTTKKLKNRLEQSLRTYRSKHADFNSVCRVVLENERSGVRVWRIPTQTAPVKDGASKDS
jgi:hypothetical protein